MTQVDTNTNTNETAGENQEVKNLRQLAIEERMGAGWRASSAIGITAAMDKKKDMSQEEREEYDRREAQFSAVTGEVRQAIYTVFENAKQPTRILVLPEMMAMDEVLGSTAAVRILLDPRGADKQLAGDFIGFLRERVRIPTASALARKLSARNYHSSNTTLAEAIWLCELAQWMQCLTPTFGNILGEIMKEKELEELNFTEKLSTQDGKSAILREAITQQYAVVENILQRM